MSWRLRLLALYLRGMGVFDFLAVAVTLAPAEWLATAHRSAGLGEWPAAPIASYLARSASAMYALHGAIVFFVSFDVVKYAALIRFMAYAALVHGIVLVGIDRMQEMPAYWRWGEGPAFAATGLIALWLQRGDAEKNKR